MRLTSPVVRLVARPAINWAAIHDYLDDIGASDYYRRLDRPDSYKAHTGDILVETAGRLCYRSWEPGLNPNVTKIRTDRAEYLLNILKSGHGSVLEHAQYSFILQDVSRVFTHELVRHRVGVAISQESLRFVRLTDIPFWLPEWALLDEELTLRARMVVEALEGFQTWMTDHFRLDGCWACGQPEDAPVHVCQQPDGEEPCPSDAHPFTPVSFAEKKAKTSFMRRFAPEGLTTSLMWSANIRTLRHVIERRTDVAAEEEMRVIIPQLARIMAKEAPLLFGDYQEDPETGQWTTPYGKV